MFFNTCGGGGGDNNGGEETDRPPSSINNVAPNLQAVQDFSMEQGARLSMNIIATDENGDSLRFTADIPSFISYTVASNNSIDLEIDTAQADAGDYAIEIIVSDGQADSILQFTLTIITKVQYLLKEIDDLTIKEGSILDIDLLVESAHSSNINLISAPSFVSLQLNTESGMPFLNIAPDYVSEGTYQVIYELLGDLDEQNEFNLIIEDLNRLPDVTVNGMAIESNRHSFTVNEGEETVFSVLGTDADDDALVYSVVPDSEFSIPDFTEIDINEDESISLSIYPTVNNVGKNVFTLDVSDGKESQKVVFDIEVLPNQSLPDAISAGAYHTCALYQYRVYCWGLAERGITRAPTPDVVGKITHITSGAYHNCASGEKGIYCWGYSNSGEQDVPDISGEVIELASGYVHTCAITDEEFACWGGKSVFTAVAQGQAEVPEDLTEVTHMALGQLYTCALSDQGVRCWGENRTGQMLVPSDLGEVSDIAAARTFACAISDMIPVCWGIGGSVRDAIPDVLENNTQLILGNYFNACLISDGDLDCWGMDNSSDPSIWMPSLKNVKEVVLGDGHTCALDDYGIFCWGLGRYGENGPYDFGQSVVPSFLGYR